MLDVFLYGRLAGSIGFSSSGITTFAFDESYLADAERPTLSQSMLDRHGQPRAPRRSTFARLPAFFSNLLPEGRLRSYLAGRANIEEHDEFGLIGMLGDDLPGALTIRGDTEPARAQTPRVIPRADDAMRFSLAGVQLKFSAFGNDDSKGLTIPVTGVGGNWIVKLPSRRFDGVPEVEAATMTFAAAVGIDVPEHRLIPVHDINGLPAGLEDAGNAYAIKRYDRTDDGALVHQEDFAQVLSAYPGDKYKLPSMAPVAEIIADVCGSDDVQEFVRRLAFSIAIGNGDMHLKNVSLFYPDRRNPRLAPAYDFVPTARYVNGDGFAIPLARAKRWDAITVDELAEFAQNARLSRNATLATVRDTADRMRALWPTMRHFPGFDAATQTLIERHLAQVPLFGGTAKPHLRSPRSRPPQTKPTT